MGSNCDLSHHRADAAPPIPGPGVGVRGGAASSRGQGRGEGLHPPIPGHSTRGYQSHGLGSVRVHPQ